MAFCKIGKIGHGQLRPIRQSWPVMSMSYPTVLGDQLLLEAYVCFGELFGNRTGP